MRVIPALAVAILAMAASGTALADAVDGEATFKATCGVCHAVEAGKNKIGPSLAGIVGRKSGSIDGYAYSPAMKAANLTWDVATLDKYLTDPKSVVPGTKMAYAGQKDDDKRKAVIQYLSAH